MNIKIFGIYYLSSRISAIMHVIIFGYYFTGVEGFQYDHGAVLRYLFLFYKIGLIIMIFSIFLEKMKSFVKIYLSFSVIILSIPLICYQIYPNLIRIIFGGVWYIQSERINLDKIAFVDIVTIFVFAITFANERSGRYRA